MVPAGKPASDEADVSLWYQPITVLHVAEMFFGEEVYGQVQVQPDSTQGFILHMCGDCI
jgi:hypothetical protein